MLMPAALTQPSARASAPGRSLSSVTARSAARCADITPPGKKCSRADGITVNISTRTRLYLWERHSEMCDTFFRDLTHALRSLSRTGASRSADGGDASRIGVTSRAVYDAAHPGSSPL